MYKHLAIFAHTCASTKEKGDDIATGLAIACDKHGLVFKASAFKDNPRVYGFMFPKDRQLRWLKHYLAVLLKLQKLDSFSLYGCPRDKNGVKNDVLLADEKGVYDEHLASL